MRIIEIEVMVSKKVVVNYISCCVSYSARATLDSHDNHLDALEELKGQLVVKVQETLNRKNKNGNH